MTLLANEPDDYMSSNYISGSLNINPVLVRKELSKLNKMNLIQSKEGKGGGVKLSKSAKNIKLSKIFNTVKGDDFILGFSKNEPNPKCPIGKKININLSKLYSELDSRIEETLENITLEDFKNQF
jgi:Rrf2 family protein